MERLAKRAANILERKRGARKRVGKNKFNNANQLTGNICRIICLYNCKYIFVYHIIVKVLGQSFRQYSINKVVNFEYHIIYKI